MVTFLAYDLAPIKVSSVGSGLTFQEKMGRVTLVTSCVPLSL